MKLFKLSLTVCLAGTLVQAVHGQQIPDLSILGRTVQFHAFGSQGFVYTDDNNWLTMKTSDGSPAMTDFGFNASVQVTDKFRIGAQFYDRNIGQLGQWHPELDWGFADYKFTDWFGIRGGKVKTVLGLYNDTQDVDFLHTFALLPQSIYPTDLRDSTIAHTGGDVYGTVPAKRAGSFSYTVYAGKREDSLYGGYPYLLKNIADIDLSSYGGLQYGADLRWSTPVKGLLAGASQMDENITGTGTYSLAPFGGPSTELPYSETSKKDQTAQFYGEYTIGNFRFDTEYRRYVRDQEIYNGSGNIETDTRGLYVSGAYRLSKRLEVGSYYSRYTLTYNGFLFGALTVVDDTSNPNNHIYDKVVTARFDVTNYWNVKLEGHFMNGNDGAGMYPDGFYPAVNPNGLKPNTNALVIRTGVNF